MPRLLIEKTLVFQPRKQDFYSFPVDAAGVGFGGELAEGAQDVFVVVYLVIVEPFFMSSR